MRLKIFALAFVFALGPAHAACPPPGEAATAVTTPDGTLKLSDGRILKLAGVELSEDGRAGLGELVQGKTLTIRPLGTPDRWGRLAAHIDGIEEGLVARGLGHAAAQADGACLAAILNAEKTARTARSGVWSRGDYVLSANDEAGLTAALGRHLIVEGKVISARRLQGRVYLNFARYWKTGLSLIIAEKDWPNLAGGRTAESFAGRVLRVRGRLEFRAGPAILARTDEPFEILPP